jgi:hydroxycarboxylate dehydrogenase B
MPTIASPGLRALSRASFVAAGSDEREASLVADQLVEANLTGHDSHGVGLLPIYLQCSRDGRLAPNRHAELASARGPVLIIEGHRGYGQVIGSEAMALGMARAREQGVALLAIRNSFHLGRIGHFAEQCARDGFASLHFVNVIDHPPLVAPYGGAEARFSTNPFCAALPGEDGPAVLLDMATSRISIGKARVANNKGVPAPEDSLLDAAGQPTRDPSVMFREPRGALVAMGEHKGSGLAILCELLAAALTGAWTAQPGHPRTGGIINNMLSVIIDPEVFGPRRALRAEIEALIAYVKSAPPRDGFDEVLVPGEPERRCRAERLAHGIEIDERTWAEILAAAETLGLGREQAFALTLGSEPEG